MVNKIGNPILTTPSEPSDPVNGDRGDTTSTVGDTNNNKSIYSLGAPLPSSFGNTSFLPNSNNSVESKNDAALEAARERNKDFGNTPSKKFWDSASVDNGGGGGGGGGSGNIFQVFAGFLGVVSAGITAWSAISGIFNRKT